MSALESIRLIKLSSQKRAKVSSSFYSEVDGWCCAQEKEFLSELLSWHCYLLITKNNDCGFGNYSQATHHKHQIAFWHNTYCKFQFNATDNAHRCGYSHVDWNHQNLISFLQASLQFALNNRQWFISYSRVCIASAYGFRLCMTCLLSYQIIWPKWYVPAMVNNSDAETLCIVQWDVYNVIYIISS